MYSFCERFKFFSLSTEIQQFIDQQGCKLMVDTRILLQLKKKMD